MKSKLAYVAIAVAMVLLVAGMAAIMRARAWTSVTEMHFANGNDLNDYVNTQFGSYSALKIDPWPSGTHTYDGITVDAYSTHFDWTSSYQITYVVVKADVAITIFYYDSPATGDNNLYPPTNPETGKPYEISHVTFYWTTPDQEIPEVPLGTVMAATAMIFAFGAYFVLRKPKSIPL